MKCHIQHLQKFLLYCLDILNNFCGKFIIVLIHILRLLQDELLLSFHTEQIMTLAHSQKLLKTKSIPHLMSIKQSFDVFDLHKFTQCCNLNIS